MGNGEEMGSGEGGNGAGQPRPPVWVERVLRRAIRRRVVRDDVLASLAYEFREMSRSRGERAARRWYLRQAAGITLRGLTGGIGREDPRGLEWVDTFRVAVRSLRRRWPVSLAVIVTMAFGIAATTAVAGAIDTLLLRPLPYPEADRLVRVDGKTDDGSILGQANPYDVVDWKQAASFSAMAPYGTFETTVILEGGPVRVGVSQVGEGMDRVLGIHAAVGRLFGPDDYAPGVRSVVLSHAFWRDYLGADRSVVGRSLDFAGSAATIVGVLPPSLLPLPQDASLWLPLRLPTEDGGRRRAGVWLRVLARLAPGSDVEAAGAEMDRVVANLRALHPDTNAGRLVEVVPLRDRIVGAARPVLGLLAVAVTLLLLIACANIGNLLLAVAHDRRREFSIRAALGAGLPRIARLILTESAVLVGIGAVLGLLLAPLGLRGLLALYPSGLPRADEVSVNGGVLVLALSVTALATFAAGLPPLLQARRMNLQEAIRTGERGLGSRGERRARAGLVVAQVALCVVMLLSAGLLGRTFQRITRVDPGFRSAGVLTFNFGLSVARYPEIDAEAAFHEALLERIRALPGVRAAGTTSLMPFTESDFVDGFQREGHVDEMPDLPTARLMVVTPGFREALGINLIEGRGLTAADRSDQPGVLLVSQALERRYFPEGATGRRIRLQGDWFEIVGVVSDKMHHGLREDPAPELYVPRGQVSNPRSFAWVAVRTDGDPSALVAPIRAALVELDPTVAMAHPLPLDQRLSGAVAPERFRAVLVGVMALLASVLAALGIYALLAFAVARESREIGVRLALGGTAGNVVRRTVLRAVRIAAAGVALGLGLAILTGRFIEVFVPEVGTRDPLTLTLVPLAFTLLAALAALGPAWRAARVDPAVTLRSD